MAKTFSDEEIAKIREALESGRDALGNGKWTRHQDHEINEAEEAIAILNAPEPQPASGDVVTHEEAIEAACELHACAGANEHLHKLADTMRNYISQQSTKEPRA